MSTGLETLAHNRSRSLINIITADRKQASKQASKHVTSPRLVDKVHFSETIRTDRAFQGVLIEGQQND